MMILIKPALIQSINIYLRFNYQQKGENSMAEITCHVKECLNNKHNKCTANTIVLGGKGNCKSKSFARNVMKHSLKQPWSRVLYGG